MLTEPQKKNRPRRHSISSSLVAESPSNHLSLNTSTASDSRNVSNSYGNGKKSALLHDILSDKPYALYGFFLFMNKHPFYCRKSYNRIEA